jgi:hypothetical protein
MGGSADVDGFDGKGVASKDLRDGTRTGARRTIDDARIKAVIARTTSWTTSRPSVTQLWSIAGAILEFLRLWAGCPR